MQVLKFAFTGSFDLAEADVDILDEFLSCVELVLPTDTRSLIEHIALTLRRRVNKAIFWLFSMFTYLVVALWFTIRAYFSIIQLSYEWATFLFSGFTFM